MNRIDRYIARYVILGTLGMLAVLISLFALPELENEIEDVGRGQYGISDVLLYVALQIPRYAAEVFPVATLLAVFSAWGSWPDTANSSPCVPAASHWRGSWVPPSRPGSSWPRSPC